MYLDGREQVFTPSDLSAMLQKADGKDVAITFMNKGVEKTAILKPAKTDVFIVTSSGKKQTQERGKARLLPPDPFTMWQRKTCKQL